MSYRMTMSALEAMREVIGEGRTITMSGVLMLLHLAIVAEDGLPEEQTYMTHLAKVCGQTTAGITGLVDRYEVLGLVERYGSAAHDRRVLRVRLTKRGLELMRGVKAKLEGRAWTES